MENNQQKNWLLPGSILLAAILVSGALVYNTSGGTVAPSGNNGGAATANIAKVLDSAIKERVVLGDPGAPVTLVEFGDFQCPFCGKFHLEAGEQIREEYIKTGKVNMVFVDLAFLGPESRWAAQAAHCAGDQGKYWAYHDFLYEHLWNNYFSQGKNGENAGAFSKENLKQFAADLGLEAGDFNQCLDSEKYLSKVEEGHALAQQALGQRLSTPSIFVGDQLIQGAQPYNVFKSAIDQQLSN